ncbi:MAG TPA: glycosyltransferase family 4 protein [Gammaproteobacteria bacterium]|nr:glycosyltransferase family 4 protein [Gammaproteobacteria bacterium]
MLVLTSTYPRWRDDTIPVFVHELTRRLARDFEMHVLAPHAPGAYEEESLDGVDIHRFRYLPARFETLAYGGGMLPGLKNHPWRLAALIPFLTAEYVAAARLLRAKRFSLVHAHWLLPHGAIAARCRNPDRALLCTSHGSDLFALDSAFFSPFKRNTLRCADAVTVVSSALQRKAETLVGETNKIHVMPMGIDTTRFQPPTSDAARGGLLYVGRLVHEKGLHLLLAAMRDDVIRDSKPHLTVIGTGPAEGQYRMLVQELGLESQVTFLGAMPNSELAPYYQRAQVLVFPSLLGASGQQEGMGLVPLEALACECPVVASRLPAIGEIIGDRETGLLFAPNNIRDLASCMAAVLNDQDMAARIARAGRKSVERLHSWDIAVAAYRDLYLKLIKLPRADAAGHASTPHSR